MARRKRYTNYLSILFSIIIIGVFIYSEISESFKKEEYVPVSTDLIVEFIDVGQADSIYITNNNHHMLIDGGNNKDGSLLVKYFKEKNIETFDYIVATHPHEDHIGGLDNIVKNFNIDNIYMIDLETDYKSYTDLIESINKKNIKVTYPNVDDTFTLGEAQLRVIHIDNDKDNINDDSIVLKLIFGHNTFLFTGDITKQAEEKLLTSNLKSDVLKIAHHGSPYSTSPAFIKKVDPKYAIISVGDNNEYNMPSDIILNRLKVMNIETHRTDKEGTIIVKSDGENITITSNKTNTNRE